MPAAAGASMITITAADGRQTRAVAVRCQDGVSAHNFGVSNVGFSGAVTLPQVRTWCGDIVDVPAAQGPADAVFFNACFGNMHDQHAALRAACRLLRPGGHVVISHPLGRWELLHMYMYI